MEPQKEQALHPLLLPLCVLVCGGAMIGVFRLLGKLDDSVLYGAALGCGICKNLFLCNRQKTCFYLLTMPAHKNFRTKELSGQLGVARLSFGDEALLAEMMDLTPGSVTVMGLMNDTEHKVRLLVDSDLQKPEYFACHPMINTSSVRFKTSDLFETLLPALHHEPTFVELHGED